MIDHILLLVQIRIKYIICCYLYRSDDQIIDVIKYRISSLIDFVFTEIVFLNLSSLCRLTHFVLH